MAFIGCPVVGDTVYGWRKQRVTAQAAVLACAGVGLRSSCHGRAAGVRVRVAGGVERGDGETAVGLNHGDTEGAAGEARAEIGVYR